MATPQATTSNLASNIDVSAAERYASIENLYRKIFDCLGRVLKDRQLIDLPRGLHSHAFSEVS